MPSVLSSRYEVTRRGTPDPEGAVYVVLDVVHDYQARWMTWLYIRGLRAKGNTTLADELEAGMQASKDAHQKAMSVNNAPPKTKKT